MPARTLHKRAAFWALLAPAFVLSCGDKDEDSAVPYCAPTSSAGVDISAVLGDTVTLDGSASGYADGCRADGNGDLVFTWTFDSVPVDSAIDEGALSDNGTASASAPTFVPDLPGTYVLSLEVCDDVSCSDIDLVVATVSSSDGIPTADAGPDATAEVDTRVDLDGSGSSDPEGAALTYSWALSSVPDCSALGSDDLFNSTAAGASVICDCEGVFVASLVVSDGVNWSEPDYVSITCSSGNQPPVADAGDSEALSPCTEETIQLNAFGSYDPEGEELEYVWSLVSVPSTSSADESNLSSTSVANPYFTWDVEGDYTFQLQVYDGELWSAPDIVTLTMQDVSMNNSPVANAGDDQSTEATATCTTSAYVWTCDDCEAQEFELDGSGSYDDDGDEITYNWTDSTGTLTVDSPYSATTVVTTPLTSATYSTGAVHDFDVQLDVADCANSDSDIVTVTVTCTGEK